MSYTITNAEISKFESVVNHVMQQVESKLRDKAQIKRWEGAKQLGHDHAQAGNQPAGTHSGPGY
jgi:hypothetical protein